MLKNTVRMTIKSGAGEAFVDVHPSSVENMQRAGWKEVKPKKPAVKSETLNKGQ